MRIYKITYPDVENFTGCRITIWLTGCNHHCPGCHNSDLWDITKGREFSKEDKERLFDILSKPYIQGITFSGGDPIMQAKEVADLMKEIKDVKVPEWGIHKDICLYTGYTLKELQEMELKLNKQGDTSLDIIMSYCDYIVDGKFEQDKRDIRLAFRGSSNQVIWEKELEGDWVKSKLN